MKAILLDRTGGRLQLTDVPVPEPGPGEVLVWVQACGVCRTDLHIVDGDITDRRYPVIPGHQIAGTIVARTVAPDRERGPEPGTRVGRARQSRPRASRSSAWTGNTCHSGQGSSCNLVAIFGHMYCLITYREPPVT